MPADDLPACDEIDAFLPPPAVHLIDDLVKFPRILVESDKKNQQETVEKMYHNLNGLDPLSIPSIARHILSYLPYQELSSCRQVSRLFAEEATNLFETRAKISIHPFTNLHAFIDLVKDHSGPWRNRMSIGSLRKFNIKLQTNLDGGKHIDKLFKILGDKISSTEISTEIGSQSTIWKIFQKYANQLNSIILTDALSSNPTGLAMSALVHKEFFTSGEIILPSVKQLRLDQTLDDGVPIIPDLHNNPLDPLIPLTPSSAVQNLAILLLKLFPNLELLQLNNPFADSSLFVTLLGEISAHPDFQNPCKSLKILDFPLNLNEAEVILMQEKFAWPLERLQLSLRPGLRFPALYSWISSMGSTLTRLELDFVLTPATPETFPCGYDLVKMETLTLKNYYGPLDFLPFMDKLESLTLNNVNLSVAFRDEPEKSCCDQMRSLQIMSGHSNAGRMSFAHIYKNIAKFFPHLRKFRGDYLSDSNLRILIRECPLIEELLLADSVITDEGMTGIPFAKCHEIQMMLDYQVDADLVEGASDDKKCDIVKQDSIGDLKYLKKLHINSPRISNVSIFHGLINCRNLHELCMSSPLITSPVVLYFVKKVNLKYFRLFLTRSYRIARNDIVSLLENDSSSSPLCKNTTLILDGKCNACGVSETD